MQELHDQSKCKVAQGKVGLLYTHHTDIRLSDPNLREVKPVIEETKASHLIDFIFEAKQVFWSDSFERRVYQSKIDGKDNMKKVVINAEGNIEGIAVDWVYNNLFWSDGIKQEIYKRPNTWYE